MEGPICSDRLKLAIAILAGITCGMGCMSFNLGNRTYQSPGSYITTSGTLCQDGESPLIATADNKITIYYPRAFASKPNLSLCKGSGSVPASEIELVEQHNDHFVVRWLSQGGEKNLTWHAEGLPGAIIVDQNTTPASATKPASAPVPGGVQ